MLEWTRQTCCPGSQKSSALRRSMLFSLQKQASPNMPDTWHPGSRSGLGAALRPASGHLHSRGPESWEMALSSNSWRKVRDSFQPCSSTPTSVCVHTQTHTWGRASESPVEKSILSHSVFHDHFVAQYKHTAPHIPAYICTGAYLNTQVITHRSTHR